MKAAIRVDNLSKRYRLGTRSAGSYRTLRDTLTESAVGAWHGLRRRFGGGNGSTNGTARDDAFWALKDVSFEVQPGEVVGIIGRNGAGKSTLLKILSRIVEPTSGRCEVRGRMASLLEVGTGFHPELTGRENIYMNGSILGMSRKEIDRKFDEIVAFSEIEQFLDTPVKRYSSGMYVRLAFAVAAHLEPEILIVDEVLAVGDAAFQKKCLGKMQDVAKDGRTICFVSHNMAAVLQICRRGVMLRDGKIINDGTAQDAISCYLGDGRESQPELCDFTTRMRPDWINRRAELVCCRMLGESNEWTLPYGSEISLELRVQVKKPLEYLELGLALCTATGFEIASLLSCDSLPLDPVKPGNYNFEVTFSSLALIPGRYYFGLGLRSERGMEDYLSDGIWLEISPTNESSMRKIHLRKGVMVPHTEIQLTEC